MGAFQHQGRFTDYTVIGPKLYFLLIRDYTVIHVIGGKLYLLLIKQICKKTQSDFFHVLVIAHFTYTYSYLSSSKFFWQFMTIEDPFVKRKNSCCNKGNIENRSPLHNFYSRIFYHNAMTQPVTGHYLRIEYSWNRNYTRGSGSLYSLCPNATLKGHCK